MSPKGRRFDQDEFTAILSAGVAGERWAFERLYDRYCDEIITAAASQGIRDPEDLAHVVLSRVFDRLGTFAGQHPGEFTNFVRTTSQREIARALEKEAKAISVEFVEERGKIVEASDAEVVGNAWVDEALALLPDDQRIVIELRVLEDLSIIETSERLGRSSASVRNLQYRAVRALRSMLTLVVVMFGRR